MFKVSIALACVLLSVSMADAQLFRRSAANCASGQCSVESVSVSYAMPSQRSSTLAIVASNALYLPEIPETITRATPAFESYSNRSAGGPRTGTVQRQGILVRLREGGGLFSRLFGCR